MSARSELARVISQAIDDSAGRVTVRDVVELARDGNEDLIASLADDLAYEAMVREAKQQMRGVADSKDAVLPGLAMPAWIAVRPELGEVVYVRFDDATQADLIAGLAERENNVVAAQDKLREYQRGLALLLPVLQSGAARTAGEAARVLARAVAA